MSISRKIALLSVMLAVNVNPISSQAAETMVEYENLSQLLLEGCLELQQANESYYTNKQNYENMLTEIRNERDYMKLLEDQSDEDSEEEASYNSNAAVLSSTAEQISKQIERLNRKSSTLTVTENLNIYTKTAQTRMITCNQLVLAEAAQEKAVDAAKRSYEDAVIQQQAGMKTAGDVMALRDTLKSQQSQLDSCRQQLKTQRQKLLAMLGLSDQEDVVIGTVPQPDLTAIDAIDFESDKNTAIGYNDQVKNARHASAGTPGEVSRRFNSVAEAEGTAEAEITAAYQELNAERTEYEAARAAYANDVLTYQSLQLKKQAGMLSEAEWLRGETEYLQAEAEYQTAGMELVQAYEDYRWLVVGIS